MSGLPNVQRRLFGLSPKKVKEYIRVLRQLQEAEIQLLQKKLDALKNEHEKLNGEILNLQARMAAGETKPVLQSPIEQHAEEAALTMEESEEQEGISTVVEPESQPESVEPAMTNEKHVAHENQWELAEQEAAVASVLLEPVQLEQHAASSVFWGDIGEYLHTETVISQNLIPQRIIPEPSQPAIVAEKPKYGQESPVLADEILSIRERYLIGKLAGEDLFGRDGARIIAKGGRITRQVIEKADQEGKLSNLILNMVIPDE